jgi:hypothetical protein
MSSLENETILLLLLLLLLLQNYSPLWTYKLHESLSVSDHCKPIYSHYLQILFKPIRPFKE